MKIEITRPEVQALLQSSLRASGLSNPEDVIFQALREFAAGKFTNLAELLMKIPIRGCGSRFGADMRLSALCRYCELSLACSDRCAKTVVGEDQVYEARVFAHQDVGIDIDQIADHVSQCLVRLRLPAGTELSNKQSVIQSHDCLGQFAKCAALRGQLVGHWA